MKMRLTDNLVKALKSPDDRDYLTTHDEEITGFGVRVTRAGTKSFVLNYRAGRRERRLTIGKLPDWSVKAAREQAKTLRRQVDFGDDPMASRHADRAATRVFELAERYQREHASKKRPSSQRNDALNIKNHIVPRIGQLAVKDVTFSDIDRLHQSMINAINALSGQQGAGAALAHVLHGVHQMGNPSGQPLQGSG